MMEEETDFTDSMHVRASLLTDFSFRADIIPDNECQGMLLQAEHRQRDKELIHHFRQWEATTIARVLEHIDRSASKRIQEGLHERNFAFGVLNSFFIFYVFGRWPEHFWILYFAETAYFVPRKFVLMWRAKPLNQALYYLDLCWMLNFIFLIALVTFVVENQTSLVLPEWLRKHVYLAALGTACGPLMGATFLLPFVSFLFHDLSTMTGLFIHILPPFLAYTFRWHSSDILQSWSHIFPLKYADNIDFFPASGWFFFPGAGIGSVAGNSIALYFAWFVPYVIWMCFIGLHLPRAKRKDGAQPKYDTVFHSTVRGGLCITIGSTLWNRPKAISLKQMEDNDFELRDFLAYMVVHAILAVFSIYTLAYPCFINKTVHVSFLYLLTCICVYRGAKRYTFYSTTMYGRIIRKEFADILQEETSKSK